MNLQMGTVSPQCHVQFDDFFETVKYDQDKSPASTWAQLDGFKKTSGEQSNVHSRGRSINEITDTKDTLGADVEVTPV